MFLKILDKCFAKPNPLCKIFNRDIVKSNLFYQATVKESKTNYTETHIGLRVNPFKIRYINHLKSFKHKK